MLATCSRCPGFLPPFASACPHCGEPVGRSLRDVALAAAKVAAAGAVMMTLMACYGGGSDDGPFIDDECFSDFDCPSGLVCDFGFCTTAEICGNGIDDDFDGLTDAQDDECIDQDFELDCGNVIDDDADGLADCQDPDCNGTPGCLEICGNGQDDDADGLVDCADEACSACPTTETECGNLFDDDQDGTVDCDDVDCAAVCVAPVCGDALVAPTEECDDGNLIDGDGCSAICEVEPGEVCENLAVLPLGTTDGSNAGTTNVMSASCVVEGGTEVAYSFTAAAAGTLFVSLEAAHDMGLYAASECGEAGVELACDNSVLGGQLETIGVAMTQGQTIMVVADGAGPDAGGPFQLTASFVEE